MKPLGLIHQRIAAKIKESIINLFSFFVMKKIEETITIIKNGSEKPRVEFWINLGSNAKNATASKLKAGLKNLFDNR